MQGIALRLAWITLLIEGTLHLGAFPGRADVIYQADDPSLTLAYSARDSGTAEIGDEIVLSQAGFRFTGISIKYYSTYDLLQGLTLTIYPQTGPVVHGFSAPDISNPLFQIKTDIEAGNHVLNVGYSLGDFYLPSDFTFTLKFDGMTPFNDADAGVFLGGKSTISGFDPSVPTDCSGRPPPGGPLFQSCKDENTVWTRTGPNSTDWFANHVTGGYGNLNVVVTGNAPEPSILGLGIFGSALCATALRKRAVHNSSRHPAVQS